MAPSYHILRHLGREIGVILPPIETYGLSFINGTDEQTDSDREQFHVRKGNANVTRDHESFVKNPIQYVQQVCCSGNRRNSLHNIQEVTEEIA